MIIMDVSSDSMLRRAIFYKNARILETENKVECGDIMCTQDEGGVMSVF